MLNHPVMGPSYVFFRLLWQTLACELNREINGWCWFLIVLGYFFSDPFQQISSLGLAPYFSVRWGINSLITQYLNQDVIQLLSLNLDIDIRSIMPSRIEGTETNIGRQVWSQEGSLLIELRALYLTPTEWEDGANMASIAGTMIQVMSTSSSQLTQVGATINLQFWTPLLGMEMNNLHRRIET